jgi:hypothetical protein
VQFQEYKDLALPRFIFYKGGERSKEFEGCQGPQIEKTLDHMCSAQP